MKRYNKTSVITRTRAILQDNEGTSLLLVAVIAILIITGVVILRVTTTTLWAAADKQQYQDKAYVMASSMGESLDTLIVEQKQIDLSKIAASNDPAARVIVNDTLPDGSEITADVRKTGDVYIVTVRSTLNNDFEYVYTATYSGSGTSYTRQ